MILLYDSILMGKKEEAKKKKERDGSNISISEKLSL